MGCAGNKVRLSLSLAGRRSTRPALSPGAHRERGARAAQFDGCARDPAEKRISPGGLTGEERNRGFGWKLVPDPDRADSRRPQSAGAGPTPREAAGRPPRQGPSEGWAGPGRGREGEGPRSPAPGGPWPKQLTEQRCRLCSWACGCAAPGPVARGRGRGRGTLEGVGGGVRAPNRPQALAAREWSPFEANLSF